MNKNQNAESVGPPKTPSARPGIHDHCRAIDRDMVKYNVKDDSTDEDISESSSSSEDLGVDEVDCPRRLRKSKVNRDRRQRKGSQIRRNSLNISYENQASYERLAKSLPATFPSLLSSSNRSLNTSLPPRLDIPEQDISFPSDIQDVQNSIRQTSHHLREENKQGIRIFPILMVLMALVTVVTGIWWAQNKKPNTTSPLYDGQKNFINELNTLGQKYSINEDSILLIQSGISTIFQNEDAGSFIFVYNSKTKSFEKNSFNNLINSISAAAARYLRKDSKSTQNVHHTEIEPSKLAVETHSELIQKYRDDVKRTGLMLVKDIDRVPSALAMAFHYYCDEYNPLVKRSAIFFTLDIANCSVLAQQQLNHAFIEKCLSKKWTSVPKDNIGPLLTRVVGTIVDTTSAI